MLEEGTGDVISVRCDVGDRNFVGPMDDGLGLFLEWCMEADVFVTLKEIGVGRRRDGEDRERSLLLLGFDRQILSFDGEVGEVPCGFFLDLGVLLQIGFEGETEDRKVFPLDHEVVVDVVKVDEVVVFDLDERFDVLRRVFLEERKGLLGNRGNGRGENPGSAVGSDVFGVVVIPLVDGELLLGSFDAFCLWLGRVEDLRVPVNRSRPEVEVGLGGVFESVVGRHYGFHPNVRSDGLGAWALRSGRDLTHC